MNPCGGVDWRWLDDGRVEVGGVVQATSPGDPFFEGLAASWESWRSEILAAAERWGLPPEWILALMAVETGAWADDPERQASIGSSAGAVGLMQIMPSTARYLGYDADDRYDPALNVLMGAKLFRELVDRHGDAVAATAPYNSGRLCCPGRNAFNLCTDSVAGVPYPALFARNVNGALEHLDTAPSLAWVGVLGLAAGAGLFWLAVR